MLLTREELISFLEGEIGLEVDYGMTIISLNIHDCIKKRTRIAEGEDFNFKYIIEELEIYVDDNLKDTKKGTIKVMTESIKRCPECNGKITSELISANPYNCLYNCENNECNYHYFIVD